MMEAVSNYLDIPIGAKLKILRMLDKKQVLLCRLICRDFVPREMRVGLILAHRVRDPVDFDSMFHEWTPLEYRATVALDLSPTRVADVSGNSQTKTDLAFHLNLGCEDQYIIQDKNFTSLNEIDFPVSLLANTELIFMFGTSIRLSDVDMIEEHCHSLKRCAMIETSEQIVEKMATVCLNNRRTLTQVGFSDVFVDANVAVDCGIIQKQPWLSCFDCGNLPPTNFDHLANGITSLTIYTPVSVQDLLDVAAKDWSRFDRLERMTLVVNEWRKSQDGQYQVFTPAMLVNLCRLPRLNQLTLRFPMKTGGQVYARQLLNGRLKPMLTLCRGAEGINGEIKTDGFYFCKKIAINLYTFQAHIKRPEFNGLQFNL